MAELATDRRSGADLASLSRSPEAETLARAQLGCARRATELSHAEIRRDTCHDRGIVRDGHAMVNPRDAPGRVPLRRSEPIWMGVRVLVTIQQGDWRPDPHGSILPALARVDRR